MSSAEELRRHRARERYRDRRRRAGATIRGVDWAESFLARVEISEDGCWEWQGRREPPHGYGRLGVGGTQWLAHRLSYLLHFGDLPSGAIICHHCDNPPCVNPAHLFAGSDADNAADKCAKGRHRPPRGEASGLSKLTAQQVIAIRQEYAAGVYQRDLARKYGISQAQVSNIVRRRHWGDLPDAAAHITHRKEYR